MSAQNGRWKDRMSQSDLDAADRGIPAIAPPRERFARDSALEGDGFEPSVPRKILGLPRRKSNSLSCGRRVTDR